MLSADQAMDQAYKTARVYAFQGKQAYEEIFGMSVKADPQAAATFVASFMRTAALDYDTYMNLHK